MCEAGVQEAGLSMALTFNERKLWTLAWQAAQNTGALVGDFFVQLSRWARLVSAKRVVHLIPE